jgi:hypothetical protein
MKSIQRYGRLAVLGACFGTLAGCADFLEVTQTTEPEAATILDNDEDFNTVAGSPFGVWWGTAQGSRPTNSVWLYPVIALSALGEEFVMTPTSTSGHVYVAQEPRDLTYDNDQFGGNWFFRKPFYDMYHCTATAIDVIKYLNEHPNRRIGNATTGDGTNRVRWFNRLMLGICHVYAGMLYDQGYTVDETFDTQNPNQDFASMLKPHWEVTAWGIEQLEMAIEEMAADTVTTIPANWINRAPGDLVTNQDLIRVAHSMIARALVYNARTPGQRAAVDWARVITEVDAGITEDFYVQGVPSITSSTGSSRFDSQYQRYGAFLTDVRMSNWIVGPADTTGAFQAWVAAGIAGRDHFIIKTPDRRIHGNDLTNTTLAPHKQQGVYMLPRTSQCTAAQRTARGQSVAECFNIAAMSSAGGTYRRSAYSNRRYIAPAGQPDHWNNGQLVTMSVQEMQFLKAEAYMRLGQPELAVPIINAQGRVSRGQLAPATVDGAGTLPTCVPRKADGSCGDLWDVLMYEKRLETALLEALVPFADYRGWGLMPVGTICQLAPPGRELELIGVPYYSFGGNAPGSVGAPPATSGATCTD